MRDGNHNLKISIKTLSGFEYKPEVKNKSGSKLVVRDENGKILHEGEFKSFTANFMKLLYGNMIGSGTVAATDLNGDSSDINSYPNVNMNFANGSGFYKFGISVGTGSGAVAGSDNDLIWASDLTYNNVVVSTPTVDGTTIKLDITREISNTSGGTKVLLEAGLICGSEGDYGTNILVARDLLTVVLSNNLKSTWTYSITVDFDNTTGGFVKNFLDSLITQWTRATSSAGFSGRSGHTSLVFDSKMWVIGGHDISTFLKDVWYSGNQVKSDALITDDTLGLIVGTSDAVFLSTDTDLNAKIEHGIGAGQLAYGAFPDGAFSEEPTIDGSKTTMTLSRSFENYSGSSITIKEVGIMSVSGLLCRIIPATPIVVENGASEIISIVFETEV